MDHEFKQNIMEDIVEGAVQLLMKQRWRKEPGEMWASSNVLPPASLQQNCLECLKIALPSGVQAPNT